MLTAALDAALDRSVVPGFSRLGYRARRLWWPADPAPDAQRDKVVAITGANSGLGAAAALGAARLGAQVHLLCRDGGRGERAAGEIRAAVPSATVVVDECDLGDLAGARSAAERLRASVPALDVLVHNAGALPAERTESADGHELTVQVHVLGPHLLTAGLREVLADDARVIFVSSGGMYSQRLPVDDWDYEQGPYRGATAYARSKRMQVVLAERWQRALHGRARVHSMHPGWASTPGVQDSLPGFTTVMGRLFRTPEQGADTTVWLMSADVEGGRFWHDRRPRSTVFLPGTRVSDADAERLWTFVTRATGAGSPG